MYRGFKISDLGFNNEEEYHRIGKTIFDGFNIEAHNSLKKYVSINGVLDGAKMQEDWFPSINAHVFISHSHNDRDLAITFAGFLKKEFQIISFIDSCIWGYANDLLKLLDNKYCKIEGKNSYQYDLRNYSTSHVHMMLSTALTKMIDKTECLFFINTPNSILASEIEEKTLSPWIYSEIETSKMIRVNLPYRPSQKMFSGGKLNEADERLLIKYPIDSGHLTEIEPAAFNEISKTTKPEDALDGLYELFPIKK